MALTRAYDELVIPRVSWPVIRSRLQRMWFVRDAPHHSLIGQTRSGKSYLARHGILPTCAYDRVLFIDCKGDDPTINGLGTPVHRFPRRTKRMTRQMLQDETKARQNWFRLITHPDFTVAREQVGEALQSAFREGNWIIVADELRYLADAKEPGLGLKGLYEQIILRGGSRGVGMVSLTQEPRWVPGSFYTQSSFYWFSRIEDEAALKRVSEVGSSRALLPLLTTIPRHHWIYMDNLEDERYWALTKVGS